MIVTAFAAEGFEVDQWLVNRQLAQGGGSSYTQRNLQQDTAISVTFKESKASYWFSNPDRIVIRDNTIASPYPSRITVADVRGPVNEVAVTVTGLSHTYARDLAVLLVNPNGEGLILMRKAGGKKAAAGVSSLTLTFSDTAPSSLPAGAQLASGTYKPADFAPGTVFSSSAPPSPYASSLGALSGGDPNGAWSLYVADADSEDTGVIDDGWSLAFSTGTSTANTSPSISPIGDLTIQRDTPSAKIVFSIADQETPDSLTISAASSNKALVPDANIVVSSGGSNRTVVITPAPGQLGVTTITLTVTDGGSKTASASFALTVIPPQQPGVVVPGDFNSDGLPDLVFQDRDGFLAAWFMSGSHLLSATLFEPSNVGDLSYRVMASADFDQDGREDLLFQNRAGVLAVWLMYGTRMQRPVLIEPNTPESSAWNVAVTADLNGDGKPDLVLQHTDGTIDVWFMDGPMRTQRVQTTPNTPGDRKWRVVATGDFDGDQRPDLVFQHADGDLAVWLLNGTTMTAGLLLNPQRFGDTNARLVSTADRNRGGKADLLFQHATDGSLTLWLMDGINRSSVQQLNPPKPGGTWTVVGPR